MAKTEAPLLSFGGSGQIAKTLVYSSWKGVKYARRHVIPSNPQTVAQQHIRTMFAMLREMFKLAPAILTAPWESFAQGRPFTAMNKFVGENIRVLKNDPDLADFIFSPGAKGGLPPETFTAAATANPGEIDIDFAVPAGPAGWVLTSAQYAIIKDQEPDGIFQAPIVAGEIAVGPYSVVVADLDPATNYVVGGWLKWAKPDGTAAYSASLSEQVVTV